MKHVTYNIPHAVYAEGARQVLPSLVTAWPARPVSWSAPAAASQKPFSMACAMPTDLPHPGAAAQAGAVLRTAYRRKHATYPELATGGAQTLCVLGCEVGGRWNADAVKLVQRLVALRAHRAPPAVRASAKAAWARRWWSVLSVAVQQAVAHTALGRARAMPGPAHTDAPALDEVLHLADPDGPSRLPLR